MYWTDGSSLKLQIIIYIRYSYHEERLQSLEKNVEFLTPAWKIHWISHFCIEACPEALNVLKILPWWYIETRDLPGTGWVHTRCHHLRREEEPALPACFSPPLLPWLPGRGRTNYWGEAATRGSHSPPLTSTVENGKTEKNKIVENEKAG